MAGDEWTFTAVYALPDGSFVEEPLRCPGALPEAAAIARRDLPRLAFGRRALGFSACSQASASQSAGRAITADTSRPMAELLAPHGCADDGRVAEEPARLPVDLASLDALPWWSFEASAGLASRVGLALGRCAALDAEVAEAAAREVGEGIIAQHHLSEATAQALPFVVTLLEHPEVRCRETLVAQLEAVVASAFEANDLGSNLLALTARLVARELAGQMAQHQRAARESARVLDTLRPRLEALKRDGQLGPRVAALLDKV
jgi:hypothetical protein